MKNRLLTFICLSIALFTSGAEASSDRTGLSDESVVLIGGDTHFGENYLIGKKAGAKVVDPQKGLDYQRGFANLNPLLARSSFTFVNLETPLSAPLQDALGDKKYVHWTDPEKTATALADAGIDAVGLANNHAYDQGEAGLRKTLTLLNRVRISAFGAGLNLDEARAPLLKKLALPGGGRRSLAIFGMFEEREKYRNKFNVYAGENKPGVVPIDVKAFRKQVVALRSGNPDVFVIAFPHWGENYSWANQEQFRLGHQLIDAGADMVIGAHAHNLQEIERYRDKWILYGIGNFLFNAPGRYADHPDVSPFDLIVELSFGRNVKMSPAVRLHPFLSDNKKSNYQPRSATVNEATNIISALQGRPGSKGFSASLIDGDPAGVSIQLTETAQPKP